MFPSLAARAAAVALGLAATAAVAAPPPGHLSPQEAIQLMQKEPAPELSRTGKVISHMDANEYTYAQVSEQGQTLWLAAPLTPLKDGDTVRYPDGVVMRDFYSKLLKRSFPAVMFVEKVEASAPRR